MLYSDECIARDDAYVATVDGQLDSAAIMSQECRQPGRLWLHLAQRVPGKQREARDLRPPGGLWARLATASSTPPAATAAGGIWAALVQRSDPARYRPQRIDGVAEEEVVEADQTYTVLRSPNGTYLRLTPAERELWHAMDGRQTVTQLATLGFLRRKQLLPVADLVQSLKLQGFLTDTPGNIYQRLSTVLEQRSAEGWGWRVLRFLQSHSFAIEGIDSAVTALYRWGGWLFFTRPFAVLHALISIAGLIAFGLAMAQANQTDAYKLLDAGGITTSLLALWAAVLVSFVLHEMAHALAVKHYGRRVQRGGVMLYYGMPAAFVDTSDIWLAPRRARIVVSLAGPLSDLLVGGIAALLAYAMPDAPISAAAYKLAFACYVATLLNFNPLLELDGYFVLVDWLRLPNLRQRALEFVGGSLWHKLRTRAPFSAEERIFGLYGSLTAIYTFCAIILAGLFWQRQLIDVLAGLWVGGWGGRVLALVIVVAVIVPICLGILLVTWSLIRGGANWIERRGYSRRPQLVAVLLLTLVLLLVTLPLRFANAAGQVPLAITALAPLLLVLALLALLAIRPDYRGAKVALAIDGLLLVHSFSLVTIAGRTFAPQFGPVWMLIDGTSLLLLMFTGFIVLLDVDLHQAPPRELLLTAFLMVAAFGLGGAAIYRAQLAVPTASFAQLLLAATPVYAGTLALALLLPHLMGLRDSRLLWCWLLLWLGGAGQVAAYMLELHTAMSNMPIDIALNMLAAGLWATAWLVHYVTLRSLSPEELGWPNEAAMSEALRLQRAFRYSYAGCYRLLRSVYGARRAQALDDRMDVLAATANWDVTLDRDQVRIGADLAAAVLDVQGARYAEVLNYTVALIEEIGGATFARRVIQASYDAIPWPEREAADRYCFPNAPWAKELSRSFGDERVARIRLLRQVELFAAYDDAELGVLAAALQQVRIAAGYTVLEAGTRAPGLWIIEGGEIAVWHGRQVLAELHRGEWFGNTISQDTAGDAEPGGAARNGNGLALAASGTDVHYRATIASTLLFLPSADFRRIAREMTAHTAENLEALKVLRLMERVSIFSDVPRHILRELARQVERLEVPARQVIVQQGQPSGRFYLIKSGQAMVVVRSTANGAGEPGPPKVVAQLGPDEFFGELEMLRGTPPVASVVALTPMVLLTLPHTAIAELLMGGSTIARGLEQIGSGRLRELRRT